MTHRMSNQLEHWQVPKSIISFNKYAMFNFANKMHNTCFGVMIDRKVQAFYYGDKWTLTVSVVLKEAHPKADRTLTRTEQNTRDWLITSEAKGLAWTDREHPQTIPNTTEQDGQTLSNAFPLSDAARLNFVSPSTPIRQSSLRMRSGETRK